MSSTRMRRSPRRNNFTPDAIPYAIFDAIGSTELQLCLVTVFTAFRAEVDVDCGVDYDRTATDNVRLISPLAYRVYGSASQ